MKFTTIIFDMDGTIIETEHIWKEANKKVLENRGVIFTPDIEKYLAKHLNGLSFPLSCAIIKDVAKSVEPLEIIMKEKSEIACALYAEGVRFVPGFEAFHKAAVDASLKTGLATNAENPVLTITNDLLKLDRFFGTHLYNVSHVNSIGKPHPAVYLYAAKQLESDPKQCIAIEDSTHGIQAAKSAGMFCIGINTGKDKSRLSKADLIIDAYSEIVLDTLLQK